MDGWRYAALGCIMSKGIAAVFKASVVLGFFSTLWAGATAYAGLAVAWSDAWWRCKCLQQLTQLLLQVFEKDNFAGLEEMKLVCSTA